MKIKRLTSPLILPVAGFAGAILLGALLLASSWCASGDPVSFVDALFISTSAVCVTGLASVDPSAVFNRTGHTVMLVLIQLGGLGITTYSTLIFYLFSRRISLANKLVGEALLLDTSFHLGRFLQRVITIVLLVEGAGALMLYILYRGALDPFHAAFLAVSAFCNAGFVLWPDSLLRWEGVAGANSIIMSLIVLGGLGFFVLDEVLRHAWGWMRMHVFRKRSPEALRKKLSYHARLVIMTSIALIVVGAAGIYFAELVNPTWAGTSGTSLGLTALFHSVSSRTAGFATIDLVRYSDTSLLLIMLLMYIGGSPGSCAGGIKTTTFRALLGFIRASVLGRSQVVVQGRALEPRTINNTMVLLSYTAITIILALAALAFTENSGAPYGEGKVRVFDLMFEVFSAFGTVGLSLNVTPLLSEAGKLIICCVMFIGRIGPIWLLSSVQQFQHEPKYRLPQSDMPIG